MFIFEIIFYGCDLPNYVIENAVIITKYRRLIY